MELRALRHLCFPPEATRGRRYDEPPHPFRTVYQRDRDRIIHSRAFRRLEAKTQVFTAPHSDHFRNRLTHTIEVSQVARTAAFALGLNEDLVEALSLAHDIGHPPFGHAGEAALDRRMRQYGAYFDHNLQALRIVERFEQRYAGFPGLNLSFEVREGLIKHSRDLDAEEFPELKAYLLDQRPPLEAQLIDIADEVAYNCADLDDAVYAGLLQVGEVRRAVPLFDQLVENAARQHPDVRQERIFSVALRDLLNRLATGLIEGTREKALAAGVSSHAEVRGHPERLVRLTEDEAECCLQLKSLLGERVYRSAEIERESWRASEKVDELFEFLMQHPEELPEPRLDETRNEPLYQVVCDYIGGMTDQFLIRLHAEKAAAWLRAASPERPA